MVEEEKTGWGLLADPEHWEQLAGNPMFNMGMRLMASGYDPTQNPFQGMLTGLQQAGKERRTATKEQQEAEALDLISKYLKSSEDDRNRLQAFMGMSQQGTPMGMGNTAIDRMVSPSVQRGLAANQLDPQNEELYRRLAWQEILGGM